MFFHVKKSLFSSCWTLLSIVCVTLFFHHCSAETSYEHSTFYFAKVLTIIDGDTLVLTDRRKVRFVGIDTPECHPSDKLTHDSRRLKKSESVIVQMGRQSKQVVQNLIPRYSQVGLIYDSCSEFQNFKDQYGRSLAYVYIPLDSLQVEDESFWFQKGLIQEYQGELYICLNAYLVDQGLARVFRSFDFDYKEVFFLLEKKARSFRRGHWRLHKRF